MYPGAVVRTVLGVLVLFLPVCVPVGAQTGNDLLLKCQGAIRGLDAGPNASIGDDQFFGAAECIGYVKAAIDYTRVIYEMGFRTTCLPENLSVGQATRIIVKYLQDHPEQLHEEELVLVVSAFAGAFRCTSSP